MPPLSLSKSNFNPHHIMIISKLTPLLWKKSLPTDSLIRSLLVGFLPPVQTSLQSESLDSKLVSSSHELGDSSSSTASLALSFPRVGENSINQLSFAATYLINNEYDPCIYGIHQVEEIDYDTLSLFSSGTDSLFTRSFEFQKLYRLSWRYY